MTNWQTPIARATAADACAQVLRERILGGELRAGDKLPPERQLAEALGVNRVTLRAALVALGKEHLIGVRQGSGSVVRDFTDTAGPDVIPAWIALARDGRDKSAATDAIADLLAVRRAIGGVVVRRVLDRVDEAGAGRVLAAVEAFARVIAEGGAGAQAIARADLQVMKAIVAEAKSPVLSLCLNPVAHVLIALPELCTAMFAAPEENLTAYRAFAEALAQHARHPHGGAHELAGMLLDVLEARDRDTIERLRSGRRR